MGGAAASRLGVEMRAHDVASPHRWSKAPWLAVLAAVLLAGAEAQAQVFVDDDALPGGDGSSWATAHRFLQDALATAGAGTEIRVARGGYRPDRSAAAPDGSGDRSASFTLAAGTVLLGGYAGLATPDPDARDPAAHVTVLSGDLAGDDSVVGMDENSRHVLRSAGAAPGALLDGFLVAGGHADGAGLDGAGGGVLVDGGTVTIRACRFESNRARFFGGAVHNDGGAVDVIDCTFVANIQDSAFDEGGGGAVSSIAGATLVDGCGFEGNAAAGADGRGGALLDVGGAVTIVDCLFEANDASGTESAFGGAVHLDGSEPCLLVGSTFIGNTASPFDGDGFGGALVARDAAVDVVNCDFDDNVAYAQSDGGAVWSDASALELVACGFHGNDASFFGGAVAATGGSLDIDQSYFSGHHAAMVGGAVRAFAAALDVRDSFFIANSADFQGGAMHVEAGDAVLVRCTFQSNEAGFEGGAVSAPAGAAAGAHACKFMNNGAGIAGGAWWSDGPAVLANSLFVANACAAEAGAIGLGAESLVAQCTLSGNSAGAGAALTMTSGMLANTVLWSNTAESGAGEAAQLDAGGATIAHCCIQGWTGVLGGAGNFSADPQFAPGVMNFRLAATSPCIDAGANALAPPDAADLDGDGNVLEPVPRDLGGTARFIDGDGDGAVVVDIGAYEAPPGCPADLDGDGAVGAADLVTLLLDWGPCAAGCAGDLDGSGTVDVTDLVTLIMAWGTCAG